LDDKTTRRKVADKKGEEETFTNTNKVTADHPYKARLQEKERTIQTDQRME
jgi:hypothetical protein